MKKLLALLLALVLPGMASAESYRLSLSLDVDEALFTFYAKQELQGHAEFASINLDSLLKATVQILDGLAIDINVQEDAAQMKLQLGKGELLNLTLHAVGQDLFLTTPMLSGYAIQTGLPAIGDQTEIGSSMKDAAASWAAEIEPLLTTGVFHGDAFEEGTHCSTWVLSDADIAALISALTTEQLRAAVTAALDAIGQDAAEVLAAFDAMNDRVASADEYYYVLRLVTDDAEEFVGASLTVLNDQAQVATISFGQTEKTICMVVGLGLHDRNYWWEFNGKTSQLRNITYFSGTAREWVADKLEAFSYVSETNAPVSEYMIRSTFTKSGNRYLWDGNISMGDEVLYNYVYSSSGTWIPADHSLSGTFSFGDAPYEPLKINFCFEKAERIDPMSSGATTVSLIDSDDAELYQELASRFAASVMARLIKILPVDLLMTINQFTLPQ